MLEAALVVPHHVHAWSPQAANPYHTILRAADVLVATFAAAGQSLFVASLAAGITGSIADKMIATFVGLAILRALPSGLTAGVELPPADQMGNVKLVVGGIVLGIALVLLSVFVVGPALAG